MAEEAADPGGGKGFGEIVEAHWGAVYRLLVHLAGHAHDAEEMTQETFLRALKNWSRMPQLAEPGAKVRAWLMRIAHNHFLDESRRKKRHRPQALEHDVAQEPIDPARSLEVREQSERLRRAMTELSETTRLVFHLRVTEDMAFREIAELAQISEDAARWHMGQARTKLLKRMIEPS